MIGCIRCHGPTDSNGNCYRCDRDKPKPRSKTMMTDTDALRSAIGVAFEQELQRIADCEIDAINDRVRQRVREATTNFAAKICERMSFNTVGRELIIRVEFKDIKL